MILNKKIKIEHLRLASQIFFFILLIYGGFLYLPQINSELIPFVEKNSDVEKISSLAAPQDYTEVLDTYTPFRTCRYLDGNRIFRACSIHYLTEVPVYGVPFYDFIPHFLIIVALSFIFARFFCGWVCPLGFTSDLFGHLRKLLGMEKTNLPKKFLKILEVARTIWISALFLLAIAIVIPFIGLSAFKNELFLIACQTCPARNIFPLLSLNIPGGFLFDNPITAFFSLIGILLLLLLSLGFFGKRIWCRFCPNGIIQSWFNKGCLITKEKDLRKCTKCGICQRVCPMDNEKVFKEKKKKNVNSKNCIMCFNCIDKCPENKCLSAKFCGSKIFESKLKKIKK